MKKRKLAKLIAKELFSDAWDDVRADRLAMMVKQKDGTEKMRGGWCEQAVVERIVMMLKKHK